MPNPEPPLRRADLTFLQQSLARQQCRRRAYRPGPLRVYADGHERWQGDLRAGACAPFRVLLTAAVLEVFGEDAEGALLLAVVPLPPPDEVAAAGAQHLSVRLEGGQTVTIDLALGEFSRGQQRAYIIQLTYTEPPTAETPGAEVDRMHAQVTAFFAEAERLQAQALQLFADIKQTQVLHAQVKDALQRLQQLCRETPWVRRDRQDPDLWDPEMPPEDGP